METNPHTKERDQQTDTSPPVQRLKILIVEDEYVLAANLKEILESLGYMVCGIADSAETTTEKVVQCRPDLVLMDIRLKGQVDGIDVAECLWNIASIPVIYLTGQSDQTTIDRAYENLHFGYLIKPVSAANLSKAITTALKDFEPYRT